MNRRTFMCQLGAGYCGLSLTGLLQARAAAEISGNGGAAKIKSCIVVFYYGGPSHLDTFDLKPSAPAEVRGEFQPISTSVPGLQISEHLPCLAKVMHKAALIRSMSHGNRLHDSASTEALTGRPPLGGDRENFTPVPEFFPCFGATVSYMLRKSPLAVRHAALPWVFHNVVDVPCQGGGFLGNEFDPFRITGNPEQVSYRAAALERPEDLSARRLTVRRELLDRLDRGEQAVAPDAAMRELRGFYDKALELMESQELKAALDISREDQKTRDRYGYTSEAAQEGGNGAEKAYGRNLRGQNLLVARRLVEAGVPFVNVYDYRQQGQNWDAHSDNFGQHKNHLLPPADRALAALIEDLDERGLLDSTLIVAMGEFGRTPQINGNAGRDHWPDCYSVLLAGGGVKGGFVYGASDRLGAYPATDPVTPADLAATIYSRFGLDPHNEIHDLSGRPYRLAEGQAIGELFESA